MSKTLVLAANKATEIEIPEHMKKMKGLLPKMQEQANILVEAVESVTDYTDPKQLEIVKRARLDLRKFRTEADSYKKDGKEELIKEAKLWDDAFNKIKAFCESFEKKAKEVETRGEREQAEAMEKQKQARLNEVKPYVEDMDAWVLMNPMYGEIPSMAWDGLVDQTKILFEAKKAKAEQEAREKEEAERIQADRITRGRKRMKAYGALMSYHEVKDESELADMSEEDFIKLLSDANDAKSAKEKAEQEARDKREAKLKAEREELERINEVGKQRIEVLKEGLLLGFVDRFNTLDLGRMSEQDWKAMLEKAKKDLADKLDVENKKREKEEVGRARFREITDRGLIAYNHIKGTVEMGSLSEDDFDKLLADMDRGRQEQLRIEQEQAKKAEQEKLSKASDNEKLSGIADKLAALMQEYKGIKFKSSDGMTKYNDGIVFLRKAYKTFKS